MHTSCPAGKSFDYSRFNDDYQFCRSTAGHSNRANCYISMNERAEGGYYCTSDSGVSAGEERNNASFPSGSTQEKNQTEYEKTLISNNLKSGVMYTSFDFDALIRELE